DPLVTGVQTCALPISRASPGPGSGTEMVSMVTGAFTEAAITARTSWAMARKLTRPRCLHRPDQLVGRPVGETGDGPVGVADHPRSEERRVGEEGRRRR